MRDLTGGLKNTDRVVMFDQIMGERGTKWPVGSVLCPVNNMEDARAIAECLGESPEVQRIVIENAGSMEILADYRKTVLYPDGINPDHTKFILNDHGPKFRD